MWLLHRLTVFYLQLTHLFHATTLPVMSSPKIGLLIGSARAGNTAGVAAHIATVIAASYPAVTLDVVDVMHSPGHPLSLAIAGRPPAAHKRADVPAAYPDAAVRAWSAAVLAWDAVVIVTPQYNWGVPAPLKNALDQLYIEWEGMPVALCTLGARGGTKVQDGAREVFRGLHMTLADKTALVKLDGATYIHGNETVKGDEPWLAEHDADFKAMVDELLEMVESKEAAAPKA